MVLRRDEPFGQVVVPDHKELDRGTLRDPSWSRSCARGIYRSLGMKVGIS